jgi:hypothetical protein
VRGGGGGGASPGAAPSLDVVQTLLDIEAVAVPLTLELPLPDWLLECEAFAVWENEIMHPGLISNGFMGCAPGNVLMRRIIADLHDKPTVTDDVPWKVSGPLRGPTSRCRPRRPCRRTDRPSRS